jgi:hypothetical protein
VTEAKLLFENVTLLTQQPLRSVDDVEQFNAIYLLHGFNGFDVFVPFYSEV